MTDVELGSGVTAPEENPGGGGDSVNSKAICVIHIQIMKNLEWWQMKLRTTICFDLR